MDIDDSSLTATPDGTIDPDPFLVGQKQEAVPDLGDPKKSDGDPNWHDSFLQDIHGVILITGDCYETIGQIKEEVLQIFHSNSINEIDSIYGDGREKPFSAHEQSVFNYRLRYRIIELNLDSVLVS